MRPSIPTTMNPFKQPLFKEGQVLRKNRYNDWHRLIIKVIPNKKYGYSYAYRDDVGNHGVIAEPSLRAWGTLRPELDASTMPHYKSA